MKRREFNLLALAGLASASLPQIAAGASPRESLSQRLGPPVRTYLAAIGGRTLLTTSRAVPKSTSPVEVAFRTEGVIMLVAGVFMVDGEPKLYHLRHNFFDPLKDAEAISLRFEQWRARWQPCARLYEAGGMLEPLLAKHRLWPSPTCVSEICVATNEEELADSLPPRKVADTKQQWNVVGPVEPHRDCVIRKIFPSRPIYEEVVGEPLQVLHSARLLAEIHRNSLSKPVSA